MEILATLQSGKLQKLMRSMLRGFFLYLEIDGFLQVDAIPNPSKEQLVDLVQRHFMSQVVGVFPPSYCYQKRMKLH